MKTLESENRELKQANEVLRKATAFFAMAERVKDWGADQSHDRLH
jgi:transposase-like protein